MLAMLAKAPFPYFGGKADAATHIWDALGDVAHYVEPFMGSLAVLLRRPHPCNRPYFSETVNDISGFLCNAWRAMQFSPDATAEAASWPVSECDLTARHIALVRWGAEKEVQERLCGDPTWHDAQMAGWWLWGISSWIGSGWCDGTGPWRADAQGRLFRQGKQPRGTGVGRKRPHVSNNGRGVLKPATREPGVGDVPEFHPMTMPELRRWFQFLSARLRHARILCGDWERAVTPAVLQTLPVCTGEGICGVFLDPPYGALATRAKGLYGHDSLDIALHVQDWCLREGANPKYRIALAGFEGEHERLDSAGWRVTEWFQAGFLKGGMGKGANQQHRERLWFSPACLRPQADRQQPLFS